MASSCFLSCCLCQRSVICACNCWGAGTDRWLTGAWRGCTVVSPWLPGSKRNCCICCDRWICCDCCCCNCCCCCSCFWRICLCCCWACCCCKRCWSWCCWVLLTCCCCCCCCKRCLCCCCCAWVICCCCCCKRCCCCVCVICCLCCCCCCCCCVCVICCLCCCCCCCWTCDMLLWNCWTCCVRWCCSQIFCSVSVLMYCPPDCCCCWLITAPWFSTTWWGRTMFWFCATATWTGCGWPWLARLNETVPAGWLGCETICRVRWLCWRGKLFFAAIGVGPMCRSGGGWGSGAFGVVCTCGWVLRETVCTNPAIGCWGWKDVTFRTPACCCCGAPCRAVITPDVGATSCAPKGEVVGTVALRVGIVGRTCSTWLAWGEPCWLPGRTSCALINWPGMLVAGDLVFAAGDGLAVALCTVCGGLLKAVDVLGVLDLWELGVPDWEFGVEDRFCLGTAAATAILAVTKW